jgi:hypothetical protein
MGAVAVSAASWAARKGVEHHNAKANLNAPAAGAPAAAGAAGARGMRLNEDMLNRFSSTLG